MSDLHMHAQPAYLRVVDAGDPLAVHRHTRSMRSVSSRAALLTLLRLVLRRSNQREASSLQTCRQASLEGALRPRPTGAQIEGME